MKGLGDAICPDGIQKPPHGSVTQQPQTPCNPRAQEGHISSTAQEELSSVEIPLTSPIFLWETILLLTLITMTLVEEQVLPATAVRGTAYPLRSLP